MLHPNSCAKLLFYTSVSSTAIDYNALFCLAYVIQAELELLQSHGIPSEDIVYSGICKQVSHIKYAAKNSIDLLVCDNEAELRKIARYHPKAK